MKNHLLLALLACTFLSCERENVLDPSDQSHRHPAFLPTLMFSDMTDGLIPFELLENKRVAIFGNTLGEEIRLALNYSNSLKKKGIMELIFRLNLSR